MSRQPHGPVLKVLTINSPLPVRLALCHVVPRLDRARQFPDEPVSIMASAFFYGTLMAPAILYRVVDNDGSHLQVAPAILLVRL